MHGRTVTCKNALYYYNRLDMAPEWQPVVLHVLPFQRCFTACEHSAQSLDVVRMRSAFHKKYQSRPIYHWLQFFSSLNRSIRISTDIIENQSSRNKDLVWCGIQRSTVILPQRAKRMAHMILKFLFRSALLAQDDLEYDHNPASSPWWRWFRAVPAQSHRQTRRLGAAPQPYWRPPKLSSTPVTGQLAR